MGQTCQRDAPVFAIEAGRWQWTGATLVPTFSQLQASAFSFERGAMLWVQSHRTARSLIRKRLAST
jgi:hypothetical protein